MCSSPPGRERSPPDRRWSRCRPAPWPPPRRPCGCRRRPCGSRTDTGSCLRRRRRERLGRAPRWSLRARAASPESRRRPRATWASARSPSTPCLPRRPLPNRGSPDLRTPRTVPAARRPPAPRARQRPAGPATGLIGGWLHPGPVEGGGTAPVSITRLAVVGEPGPPSRPAFAVPEGLKLPSTCTATWGRTPFPARPPGDAGAPRLPPAGVLAAGAGVGATGDEASSLHPIQVSATLAANAHRAAVLHLGLTNPPPGPRRPCAPRRGRSGLLRSPNSASPRA